MEPAATESPIPVDLRDLVAKAKAQGKQGIFLIELSGTRPDRYLAGCMDKHGRVSDPRNWDSQDSPERALADLATRL